MGKFGLLLLPENWHTHIYTQRISKMLFLISILVFSNFKPKFVDSDCYSEFSETPYLNPFFGKIRVEFSILRGSWYTVYLEDVIVKKTEKSLEAKIKINNYIKCILLLYFYRSYT